MQFGKILLSVAMATMLVTSAPVIAGSTSKEKAYTEVEFLRSFTGKSRKAVMEKLGKPSKKAQSVKPTNAAGVVGQSMDDSKPVNVEMWYYSNLVSYEPKKRYKMTELTFVNDRCMNIAFFNNL
jgi:hypothetical protein